MTDYRSVAERLNVFENPAQVRGFCELLDFRKVRVTSVTDASTEVESRVSIARSKFPNVCAIMDDEKGTFEDKLLSQLDQLAAITANQSGEETQASHGETGTQARDQDEVEPSELATCGTQVTAMCVRFCCIY